MTNTRRTEKRLRKLVNERNHEIAVEAAITAGLGLIFGIVIYTVLYCILYFVVYGRLGDFGMTRSQFAGSVTLLLFVGASILACCRFNPFAGLKPMTDQQLMLVLTSQAAGSIRYVSPTHAAAGALAILLGGPANLCEAISLWQLRVPNDDAFIRNAAELLAASERSVPIADIETPQAAVLLRRLVLVTLGGSEAFPMLVATSKGASLLSGKNTN